MTEQLQEIARRIVELKKFSRNTSVVTNRSQGELIRHLDAVQLSEVAAEVNKQLDIYYRQNGVSNGSQSSR